MNPCVLLAFVGYVLSTNDTDLPDVEDLSKSDNLQKAWEPNYCNNSVLQKEAGLQKTALSTFLGYQCDAVFFQCRGGLNGFRTYKKRCRKGLVYDTSGTQTCNYEFNVKGCGTSQCADCLPGQFACCLSEECVEMSQRCDGTYDCTLEEDEQNCPTCGGQQFPCINQDKCISLDKRCNNVSDCEKDDTDEKYCKECGSGEFYCSKTEKCISGSKRCDGKRDCHKGEDEFLCNFDADKEYLCENQKERVTMRKVCDKVQDCSDGSDEFYCNDKLSNGIFGKTEYFEYEDLKAT